MLAARCSCLRGLGASAYVGEWLSLVEHLVRDQGVGGSNPLSPTNIFNKISLFDRSASEMRAPILPVFYLSRVL